jgi:hypothetical protein
MNAPAVDDVEKRLADVDDADDDDEATLGVLIAQLANCNAADYKRTVNR